MKIIVQLIFTLTVGGSAVVICLQILRFLLQKGSTKWLYSMGKVAIALYLVPFALLFQWNFTKYIPIAKDGILISKLELASDIPIQNSYFSVSMQTVVLLFSIWAVGVLGFVGWQIYCYVKFTKILKITHKDLSEENEAHIQLMQLKKKLHIKDAVKIKYSGAIRSPFLIGLWNPVIYLPNVYQNQDINLEMIIHHELIHLKRKDVWVKTFMLVANIIHWFNPLIYILRKDIHKWSELTCDEEVVKFMSKEERKHYGETIISAMIGTKEVPVQFCSSLSDEGKQLKRRLDNMLQVKTMKKSTVLFSFIAVIFIGLVGVSTAAWASEKAPEIHFKAEDLVIEEQFNEAYKLSEELVETELIPESEATKEQIEAHQQLLKAEDVNVDFWADVEEDSILINEPTSNVDIINEVELEAGVLVEVK